MDRSKQSIDELIMEMTALVKSKFTMPYLSDEARKGLDSVILEIFREIQKRKSSDE